MGLKGYRLWVMGQLDSNVQSPTARGGHVARALPNWRLSFVTSAPACNGTS
jgi:hypothetical protein